ncbi:unnamed protein product [Adineta ricciae]|uniref:EGF-like domain-containing protein n=1 Tax=Adineta ricciae TaxID=249248 RepID=A0A814U5G9_ADIRI|nr:unnamed protein product [Adineta ricciae]
MYNSVYVIAILLLILNYNRVQSSSYSNPTRCLPNRRHLKSSSGHYLLGIEHAINNEKICKQRCSVNKRCSTARFNEQFQRCYLFQTIRKNSLYRPYQSNYIQAESADCSEKSSFLSHIEQLQGLNTHCLYDALPWQRAQHPNIFKSYTLIGTSYLACQELCSSVRRCAGVQYQTRGVQRHQCQLLRSTNPWELTSSKSGIVFAKRSCQGLVDTNNPLSEDQIPVCHFEYFGQGQHKHDKEMIQRLPNLSEIQCQYLCSTMVNCIGIEFIEKRSECILLSSNFIQNDGTIHVKYHRRHHLYMKLSCSTSLPESVLPKCLLDDIHCNCHENLCQHGTCLTEQSEGYQRMFCECDYGFTGQLCEQMLDV